MRSILLLAAAIPAACRAVPAPPEPGPDHPASPQAAEARAPEVRGPASAYLRAAPDDGGREPSAMPGGSMGGGR